jgi:hypothetical protein
MVIAGQHCLSEAILRPLIANMSWQDSCCAQTLPLTVMHPLVLLPTLCRNQQPAMWARIANHERRDSP